MGSAIGTSSSTKDRGTRTVDIRDFGAVAGGNATTNRIAIQAAIDSIGGLQGGGVYVPSGTFAVDLPIFIDSTFVTLQGEGRDSTIIAGPNGMDCVVHGIKRQVSGTSISANHMVDLFTGGPGGTPYLDGTVVGGAGSRWGMRTFADHHLAGQGGAMDQGLNDWYSTIRALTVDVAIDFSNTGLPTTIDSGAIMGLNDQGTPTPWRFDIRSNSLVVSFTTQTSAGIDTGTVRSFAYGVTTPWILGFMKITFQIDLANAIVAMWINGVQKAVNIGQIGANWNAGANLHFYSNQQSPFTMGINSGSIGGVSDYWGNVLDLTFVGLKATAAALYTVGATGSAQARSDGLAITDARRYTGASDGASIIGALVLTDPPSQVVATRIVSLKSGTLTNGTTALYFLNNALHVLPTAMVTTVQVQDITLKCGSAWYGRAFAIGWSLHIRVERANLLGGYHGIGAYNCAATYPVRVVDCTLKGFDGASYLSFASFVLFSRITVQGAHRCTLRSGLSSPIYEHVFAAAGGSEYYVKSIAGGFTALDCSWDDESVGNQIAAFYASTGSYGAINGGIQMESCGIGLLGPNTVMFYLDEAGLEDGNAYNHALFSCRGMYIPNAAFKSIVRTNGLRWQGTMDAISVLDRPTWVDNTGPDGGNVVSEHAFFTGPPRDGDWRVNSHRLRANNPANAQYTRWLCTQSGIYGTATPPRWQGFDPIDDGLGLAAYIADHSYWSQPGSPAGSAGFWANAPTSQGMNALFGGPAIPAVGVLKAALQTHRMGRWFGGYELSGNGYARTTLTGTPPFTTSAGGVMSNAQAIVFPTATGTWGDNQGSTISTTITTLTIYNGAGKIMFALDIAPFTVNSGDTPTFAIGAISLAPAGSSGQGAFATRVHDNINNALVNSVSLTVPTIYLALSTSLAAVGSSPIEPGGGSYARVATSAGNWRLAANITENPPGATRDACTVRNAVSLAFPAPTGNWGTVQSVYLMDAATGGNVLAAANLVLPRTISSGDPARAFAPGALWICRS
ncbi:MAG: hypothetical protein JWN86_2029 [Planctomycetota bacterium]|nr:hypothetical protein [Planctomycetota bacterium]